MPHAFIFDLSIMLICLVMNIFAVRKNYYFCSFCHGKSSVIINNLLLQMTQKNGKRKTKRKRDCYKPEPGHNDFHFLPVVSSVGVRISREFFCFSMIFPIFYFSANRIIYNFYCDKLDILSWALQQRWWWWWARKENGVIFLLKCPFNKS